MREARKILIELEKPYSGYLRHEFLAYGRSELEIIAHLLRQLERLEIDPSGAKILRNEEA